MRTQLIESVVIGIAIGGIVLIARLISPAQALIQLGIILIGAILLFVIQAFLVRKELKVTPQPASETPPPEAPAPITAPPSMLHSPHLGWAEDAETVSANPEETVAQRAAGLTESEQRADGSTKKVV